MGRPLGSKNKTDHKWSDEEKEYLKDIVTGKGYKEIQNLMNEKFEYQFSLGQVKGAINRYKLNTGLTGNFPKGNIPWNKGTKGLQIGGKETQFKKGNVPINFRPVESERINVEGYTEVKVNNPNRWRLKHRVLYEEYHDVKLTANDCIIFGDGDRSNLSIDNLILLTKAELLKLNQLKLIKDDADLTKAGVNVAKIILKLGKIKNKNK